MQWSRRCGTKPGPAGHTWTVQLDQAAADRGVGDPATTPWMAQVRVKLGDQVLLTRVIVAESLTTDAILGGEFLREHQCMTAGVTCQSRKWLNISCPVLHVLLLVLLYAGTRQRKTACRIRTLMTVLFTGVFMLVELFLHWP